MGGHNLEPAMICVHPPSLKSYGGTSLRNLRLKLSAVSSCG